VSTPLAQLPAFQRWLFQQAHRDDSVGHFVFDLTDDCCRRSHALRRHLVDDHSVSRGALAAFDQAQAEYWREYSRERRMRQRLAGRREWVMGREARMQRPGVPLLLARRDWLRVETVDRGDGSWDVVLRIDGTYSDEEYETKEEMVAYFTRWLKEELWAEWTMSSEEYTRRVREATEAERLRYPRREGNHDVWVGSHHGRGGGRDGRATP
jgi:hypothetical protein